MKVEVDDLGSPSLIVLMVSVDVMQHLRKKVTVFVIYVRMWTEIKRERECER